MFDEETKEVWQQLQPPEELRERVLQEKKREPMVLNGQHRRLSMGMLTAAAVLLMASTAWMIGSQQLRSPAKPEIFVGGQQVQRNAVVADTVSDQQEIVFARAMEPAVATESALTSLYYCLEIDVRSAEVWTETGVLYQKGGSKADTGKKLRLKGKTVLYWCVPMEKLADGPALYISADQQQTVLYLQQQEDGKTVIMKKERGD